MVGRVFKPAPKESQAPFVGAKPETLQRKGPMLQAAGNWPLPNRSGMGSAPALWLLGSLQFAP